MDIKRCDHDHYITGMSALAIPSYGWFGTDWSAWAVFSGDKPCYRSGFEYPSTKHIFGDYGIVDKTDYLHREGMTNGEPVFVANPERAVADIIYKYKDEKNDLSWLSLDSFKFSKNSLDIIKSMVVKIPGNSRCKTLFG